MPATTTRRVLVLSAPTSAGAYAPGQEDGPQALLDAGLLEALRHAGLRVERGGSVEAFRWQPDPRSPRAANQRAVADRIEQVAGLVAATSPDELVLVLGGDCTVGAGTVLGLTRRDDRVGLLYLDRHADLKTPDSTDEGALDWMGVAHMLAVDGADETVLACLGERPLLAADEVSFLGLESPTASETEIIEGSGLAAIDVAALIADPAAAARAALSSLPEDARIAVHFDVDVVDFLDAPLAENTNRGRGPTLDTTADALAACMADPRFAALTVTEFNPHHGAPDDSTTQRLIDVIRGALAMAR